MKAKIIADTVVIILVILGDCWWLNLIPERNGAALAHYAFMSIAVFSVLILSYMLGGKLIKWIHTD